MAAFDFGTPNNNGLLVGIREALEGGLKGFQAERDRQDLLRERELRRKELDAQRERVASSAAADDARMDEALFAKSNPQLRRGTRDDLVRYLADPESSKKQGLIPYSFGDDNKPRAVYLPNEGFVSKEQIEKNKDSRVDRMVGTRRNEREEQYQSQTRVPGFELQPGFKPPSTAVEKFRAQKTTVEKMDSTAAKLIEEIKRAGGFKIVPGEVKTNIQSLLKQLQIQAKTYNELGVLNGPDMLLLTEQIGDPTSLRDVLSRGGTDLEKQYKSALSTLRSGISEGLQTEAKNLGFKRTDGAPGLLPREQAGGPSPEEIAQAREWILKNPNDPRVPAVKAKAGL